MTRVPGLFAAVCLSLAAIAVSQPLAAQGLGHTFFMRGQVVKATGAEIIICIGKADGAQVGQTLKVVRVVERPGPPKGTAQFDRRDVGTVTITQIIDDHFARVSIANGDVKNHDLVELHR